MESNTKSGCISGNLKPSSLGGEDSCHASFDISFVVGNISRYKGRTVGNNTFLDVFYSFLKNPKVALIYSILNLSAKEKFM